ncbi:hypothetical protein PoB_001105400 [Plakobranchus ocellatus]|uniref:ABC transporter domain-containing protein n=1 Tax=Plakobranchus ocellatus TaxID=259542 RepID=A0AAV3YRE3_9GAST|nr:hypothetical protein PoB_001105400 [Plakobranchus ocellatus]
MRSKKSNEGDGTDGGAKAIGGAGRAMEAVELLESRSNRKSRKNNEDTHQPVINLKNVWKISNKQEEQKRDLKRVTFRVFGGQCFGILGCQGSGKRALLEILVGLRKPDAGKVTVRSDPTLTLSGQKLNAGLAYCPKKSGLMPQLTTRETLVLFGILRGAALSKLNSEIYSLLTWFGLEDQADRPCARLSPEICEALCTEVAILRSGMITIVKPLGEQLQDPGFEGSNFCQGYLVRMLFETGEKDLQVKQEEFFNHVATKIFEVEVRAQLTPHNLYGGSWMKTA